jgi:NADPH:quinone reductase-like Zn-dependent oxidoreductase
MFGLRKPRKEIPGWEVAGEVESVGKDVTSFKKGDKVFGFNKGVSFGATNAEYKCLPQDRLVTLDIDKMNYFQACAIPIGGLTALYFLRKGEVRKGKKILIIGASGSVGTYAVQVAKFFGAEVTGICSSKNLDLVRSLGADYVIDYSKEDFTKTGKKYDVIFDTVDKSSFSQCKVALKDEGSFITVDWPIFQALWISLTSKKKLLIGMAPDRKEDLVYLRDLVEKKKIKPVIGRIYPMDQAVEAYRYADTGHKRGNLILRIREKNGSIPVEILS